jgi:hypothetical protein
LLSFYLAAVAEASSFCNSKFGIYAYIRLVPEDANPSGVAELPGGKSEVMYSSQRRATSFLCIVSLVEAGGKVNEKCPPLMEKKTLSAGIPFCKSKEFSLKKLCPSEIKTLRFGDELFKKYCH